MKFLTFKEWLNEAKSSDSYVEATVSSNIKNLKKGDRVKVDALQYTKRGNTEKVEILLPNGKKEEIEKEFLSVKI